MRTVGQPIPLWFIGTPFLPGVVILLVGIASANSLSRGVRRALLLGVAVLAAISEYVEIGVVGSRSLGLYYPGDLWPDPSYGLNDVGVLLTACPIDGAGVFCAHRTAVAILLTGVVSWVSMRPGLGRRERSPDWSRSAVAVLALTGSAWWIALPHVAPPLLVVHSHSTAGIGNLAAAASVFGLAAIGLLAIEKILTRHTAPLAVRAGASVTDSPGSTSQRLDPRARSGYPIESPPTPRLADPPAEPDNQPDSTLGPGPGRKGNTNRSGRKGNQDPHQGSQESKPLNDDQER